LPAVLDLAGHGRAAGLVQECALEAGHDQKRHQVLEHRTAPAEQHLPAARHRQSPAESEPVVEGDLTGSDGRVARQT
jgi:hypothetical protein